MSDRDGTVEFDVDERVYRAEYDPAETAPSVAVVDLVERVRGGESTRDLPPLYEIVDPDALDSLLESRANRSGRSRRSVSFRYGDAKVTVTSDGRIAVRPGDGTEQ